MTYKCYLSQAGLVNDTHQMVSRHLMADAILPMPATVSSDLFMDELIKYLEVVKTVCHIRMFSASKYESSKKVLQTFPFLGQNFGNVVGGERCNQVKRYM